MTTKITDANINSTELDNANFNISLLGFKMAVNEGLTVFNLVDGVVDEFQDESGTDEAEGSNDFYNASNDYYLNADTVVTTSAGFTTSSVTEPDTSTAGTNPAYGSGTYGTYTVPTGVTALNAFVIGAGGGSAPSGASQFDSGGSGGFAYGELAVTGGQVLSIVVGEGGLSNAHGGDPAPGGPNGGVRSLGNGGYARGQDSWGAGGAGGLSAIVNGNTTGVNEPTPEMLLIAGGGGGAGAMGPNPGYGGNGGGLTGLRGNSQTASQSEAGSTPYTGTAGGGGGQSSGGQAGGDEGTATDGSYLNGGLGSVNTHASAAGGAGFYGGGGVGPGPAGHAAAGGGGSSYIGNPAVTGGTTIQGGAGVTNDIDNTSAVEPSNPNQPTISGKTGGPIGIPLFSEYGEGSGNPGSFTPLGSGGNQWADADGYVFLYSTFNNPEAGATSLATTIVSTSFTAASEATNARIVVFEENVDTPTLNTDIIASISRDGGTTFTNATLSDSGYVTGSSGQRILTGQADISGQPTGQSMRWKLALANNTVRIHGVSLQWS